MIVKTSESKNRLVAMIRQIIPLLFTVIMASPSYAQERLEEIDKIFSWATDETPGCVCAVSHKGKMVAHRAYGLADLERNVPLDTNSIFDAGSLVKQFVAAAALIQVEKGQLSLSEDIHHYVPELPDYGHKITIDQLMTHTSGIRDWTAIRMLSSEDEDALTMIMRQQGLNFVPGEEMSYSNSGYALLKEIIARTSSMSFGDFTKKHLFDPLGMKSTNYREDLSLVVENRALAYEKQGDQYRLAVLLDNDRGGGGALLTTASDLLIWNDALKNGLLGKFVTHKIQEKARLNNGRELGFARGLFIEDAPNGKLVWHGGSADGYKSVLGWIPEHDFSIAILCNAGELADKRVAYAAQIRKMFVPDIPDPEASDNEPEKAAVSPVNLDGKAGLFINEETGEFLHLVTTRGKLRIAGGPTLVAVSSDHFRNSEGELWFMSQDEFEINFISQDEFDLKSMEGKTTHYYRVREYNPSLAELETFDGRYESQEIKSVLRVTPGKGTVVVSLDHSPEKSMEFEPVNTDTFQWRRMIIRFIRDKTGKVVALEYSNPLLRKVEFKRVD